MNLPHWALLGAVALLAGLLPTASARRRGMAGALLIALALASLSHAGGRVWRGAALPGSFLGITAALLLAGLGIPLLLVVQALRGERWTPRARNVALLTVIAVVVVGLVIATPLAVQGGRTTLVALAGIGLCAGILAYAAPRIAAGTRWLDALIFPRRSAPSPASDGRSRGLLGVSAGCALGALLVSRLDLLLLTVVIGGLAGVLLEHRLTRRWPLVAPIALAGVLVVGYLMIHVAGETPLTMESLEAAPYSDAFEILIVLLLGLACWVLLGLWPFASTLRGPHATLLAAVLLVRVVAPILPDGATHWQPIFYLIPAIAAWHAAATGRHNEALRALGTLGLLSGSDVAGWAGIGLAACALVGEGAVLVPASGREATGVWLFALRATAVVAALLLLPLLQGALETQVVYTVLTVLGATLSLFGLRAVEIALTSPTDVTILRPGHSES